MPYKEQIVMVRSRVSILLTLFLLGLTPTLTSAREILCESIWPADQQKDYLYHFYLDPTPESKTILSSDTFGNSIGNNSGFKNYLNRMFRANYHRTQCHKAWTVLIYMTVTQDLLPYAYLNMNEMESNIANSEFDSGSSIRSDVLVQFNSQFMLPVGGEAANPIRRIHIFTHPGKSYPSPTLVPTQTSIQDHLLSLTSDPIQSPIVSIVENDPEEPESERLKKFIKWGIENYPSEHYLLVIWGHGRLGKLSIDSSGRYLDPRHLKNILKRIHRWSGKKLDILAADSCFWMAVEDIDKISNYTHNTCGSSDLESYVGFPYGSIMREINSGKFSGAPHEISGKKMTEADRLAWLIPKETQRSLNPYKGEPTPTNTQQPIGDPKAICDLTGCSVSSRRLRMALIPALNKLGNALLDFIAEKSERWMSLKSLIDEGHFYQNSTQDLGVFLKNLSDLVQKDSTQIDNPLSPGDSSQTSPSQKLLVATTETYSALNHSIINSVLGSNYPPFNPNTEMGPRGLAIWLPKTSEEFHQRIHEFSNSSPSWRAWMKMMYPE